MEVILPLRILGMEDDSSDYRLRSKEGTRSIYWGAIDKDPVGEDFRLEIETDKDMKEIIKISSGIKIATDIQEIKRSFLWLLLNKKFDQQITESDGFETTDEDNACVTTKEIKPYDPKLIRVDPKPFSIEHVCKMISTKKLDISPDFQREFVWTEITRKSRLIESILLRIPIPAFYLAQDEYGNYQVVDGIQRLTVINDFVNNKFRLKNLEYLTDLEGKWFNKPNRPNRPDDDISISTLYSGRIEDTQLFFNIIDPSTPEQVKYDIFRRINTGGKTLNAQEIRNCLSTEKTRQLLKDMVGLDSFLQATKGSVSSTRMADKEMALRFAAFYLIDTSKSSELEYKGNMDDFLDKANIAINKESEKLLQEILNAFDNAMNNAYILFGENAFRKTSFINKALFLSWARQLCKFDRIDIEKIGSIKNILDKEIKYNNKYNRAISTATNDITNIRIAYNIAGAILEEMKNV